MAGAYIHDTLIGAEVPIYGTAPDASSATTWVSDPDFGDGDYEKLADGLRVISDSPNKPAIAQVTSDTANGFTMTVAAVRRGSGIEWSVDSYVAVASPGRDWRARVKIYFGPSSTTVYAGFHGTGSGDVNFHTGAAVTDGVTLFEFTFDAINNIGTLKRNGTTVKSAAMAYGGFFPGPGTTTTPPVGPIPPGVLTTKLSGYNSGGYDEGGLIKNYTLDIDAGAPPPPGEFWTDFVFAYEAT